MRTAIITGVTGQDGALLSKFLLGKDYRVVGIDRRTSCQTDWRLRELGLYQHGNFQVVSGDLTDAYSISRLVQKYRPDEFYNLGAMSFVKESWATPSATLQINTIGTINCLEAIRNHCVSCKFYQASSSEMFGGVNRVEFLNEKSRFYPRSPYGISKLAAHWATINYRESFGLFTCCGILFNHESAYRGLEFVTRKITDGVARIKLGLQDHIELGNLDVKRDWGYAPSFVHGMWLMLRQSNPDDYVLATGEAHSIQDFVDLAFSYAELKPSIKQNPQYMRPADVGHLLGDASKARTVLKWKTLVEFEQMVLHMYLKDFERVKNEIR